MTYIYTPTITTRIPIDIPADKHPEIIAKLEAARKTLAQLNSYNRSAALGLAANAIRLSGCSACGVPGVSRTEEFQPDWDLSTIPRDLLRAEYVKTIKPPIRARVELPCIQCAHPLSARERRKPCPKCGSRQPRDLKI